MLNKDDILRDRYRVIGRLGQGGMGAVYEAHDNVFDTSVALKEVILDVTSAVDTKAQEMAKAAFEREAKLLAKINHETIPHVKDYFIEDHSQFLVMELVDGDDLAKLLKERKGAFPVDTLLDWTDSLLEALDYLHTQNPPIIHRDIKPQNLKLTTRKKIKLLDFGIAKGTENQAANTVTNQTFIAATLNYSPIEQMIRVLDPTFLAVITHKYSEQIETLLKQNADARTDLFALGATIYHLATNKHPAEAIKRGVEIWDGKPDPIEDPRNLNPAIPDGFAEFLLRSMQISRDHRFATASEMRGALHQIMDVSTKQSLTPTVEMNFEEMSGDRTTPVIPAPPSMGSGADKTVQLTSEIKPTEQKTEVLHQNTGGEQAYGLSEMTAVPPPASNTSGTRPGAPPKEKKKRSKLLWLIPVAVIFLFVFTGGALGILLVANQYSFFDSSNTNTESAVDETPEPSPEEIPSPEASVTPFAENSPDITVEPTAQPQETIETTSTKRPTPRPTRKATPRPAKTVAARTPRPTPRRTPRRTPRKTPKKNMDCIFTDTCK
jgi:serine/threonine protein kinase